MPRHVPAMALIALAVSRVVASAQGCHRSRSGAVHGAGLLRLPSDRQRRHPTRLQPVAYRPEVRVRPARGVAARSPGQKPHAHMPKIGLSAREIEALSEYLAPL